MTARHISPEEAIDIALSMAPPGMPPGSLALLALRLAGYQVVADADGREQSGLAGGASRTAVPKIKRETWPKNCAVCNKIINDKAHADACARTDCPI